MDTGHTADGQRTRCIPALCSPCRPKHYRDAHGFSERLASCSPGSPFIFRCNHPITAQFCNCSFTTGEVLAWLVAPTGPAFGPSQHVTINKRGEALNFVARRLTSAPHPTNQPSLGSPSLRPPISISTYCFSTPVLCDSHFHLGRYH